MPELVIQHDPVYWVLIDTLGEDPKAWADKMARERFPLEGREPTRKELKAMRARLQTLAEQQQLGRSAPACLPTRPSRRPPGCSWTSSFWPPQTVPRSRCAASPTQTTPTSPSPPT